MLPQQYCLRWKYHHSNLQTMFSQLLDRGCFCDVTLACEGQILRAHRVVLCACSTYFDTLLTNYTSDKDTIIIMKDAKFADIKCLIEFMYKGEINVEHASLASLLKTAEELKIKGLAEVSWRDDEVDVPQSDSDSKFLDNVEHMSGASEMSQAPLLTPIPSPNVQDNPHLGQKRKRGRPPLDEEYDVFSTPKISFVEGATPVQSFGEVTHPHEPEIIEESEKDPLAKDDWMERQNGNGDHHSHHHSSHHHHLSLEGKSDGSEMKMAKILPKSEPYDDLMDQEDNESTSDPGSNSGFFLTPKEEEMWKDVVKMDAYLAKGRRPQFWEEPFTKRVMEAIKTKELEMKKAAQLLGVSYGTLYGRYRETYGCLKHPYRGPSMVSRYREIWADKVPADFIDISSHHDSSGLDAQWVR